MHLAPFVFTCFDGTCPTIYSTDRGTFVVQGYAVPPHTVDVQPPAGEVLVEVPADLVGRLLAQADAG